MDAPPSFQFAKETVTQLLTLATALVGVSITFAKDVRVSVTTRDRKWLFLAWIIFLVSVICGVWTLMSLTGTLAQEKVAPDAIYGSNITLPSMLQIIAFVGGIIMLIVHAAKR